MRKILFIIGIIGLSLQSLGQFYYGHQMNFGKNRVQFEEFEWYFYRFERFDTYFTAGGIDIALRTATIANAVMEEMESQFDHVASKRIVFIIYDKLSDFRQSNIGLNTGSQEYNIGGVTRVIDNVAFLYIEGDNESLEIQIRSAIANVILNEMLYGENIRNKIANNALLSLPEWYLQGLIKYVSEGWNPEIENRVKAGMISGNFDNINHLTGEDAYIVGHSIWNYVANNYGSHVIPTIVYLTRVTKTIESGFLYVLGTNLQGLQTGWREYYMSHFQDFIETTDPPEGENIARPRNIFQRLRKNVRYYQPEINRDGRYIAWAENQLGKYRIRLYDTETDKVKTILRREHKLEQITDYSYPIIKWHPSGELLGFIIEKEGHIFYKTYDIETEEIRERKISPLDKIISFNYSHDGFLIVLSAFNLGQSDIFIYNIAANTFENLTMDIADDFNPVFINNSTQILFTSNRDSEELGSTKSNRVPVQESHDIFIYDIKSKTIERITNSPNENIRIPYLIDNKFLFLSDANGVYNMYRGTRDSVIRYIDTITHYNYFLRKQPLTNYPYNIKHHSFAGNTNKNLVLYFDHSGYNVFINEDLPETTVPLEKTFYKKQLLAKREEKRIREEARVKRRAEQELIIADGLEMYRVKQLIDINNYSFDIETESVETATDARKEFDEFGNAIEPRMNKYFTTFYTNYLVSQVDFGFLNHSYQKFTGSAFYFNPGFNLIFKVGSSDLFEDYRITAGFRFAGNFDSNEYLLSFENLRHRWNRQILLHRQAINNIHQNRYVKTHTHQAYYITRYPLSQVDAFQFTANLRTDRISFLSIDYETLLAPNQYDFWGSVKAEYIFDNTRQLITNIHDGFRMKAFGEYFRQIDKKESDLFVFGADLRYYLPIHRNLIIATRLAGSGSFGRAKLIYYLGGIDNWINLSSQIPTFDESIRIDPDQNYVYQAVATNMRGFSQNIRNGTNFAVFNTEIRWPVVKYLLNRPINNSFLQNFQIVGFFDVGSAWSGLTPFSGNNAYENDIYEANPVTIIIHNNNYPIVAGYGVGLRTTLLGYFVRADWAWGIENNVAIPRIFYLSLSLDF